MSRRKRRQLPQEPVEALIENLAHDGRGIARIDGKTVFVDNALPGERVRFRYTWQRRKFDEGRTLDVLEASPLRVEPPCEYSSLCGGCSLQHLDPAQQIERKQQVLTEQLTHFAGIQPDHWLPPLKGPVTGYRNKARLGAKYVHARQDLLVGFREKRNSFLLDMNSCAVLVPELGEQIRPLRDCLKGLQIRERIPQIEVAAGGGMLALVFRHLDPLPESDQQALMDFCRERGWHCYLQPGNEDTMHRVWPEEGEQRLYYRHPSFDLQLAFHPADFTQVNAVINERMVIQALELLDLSDDHHVLDLFCGLGNFTLPLARKVAHVTGVEGSQRMVDRGYENARRNGIENADFYAWDLTQDVDQQSWANKHPDRVLIDPPRTGAQEIIPVIGRFSPEKAVYVSCNPATLARDAALLQNWGYRLDTAGVMDMFPHTTHVESMALFVHEKTAKTKRSSTQ